MTHAYYAATISRGALIGLIVGAVLFAVVGVLLIEWLLPDREPSETREPPRVVSRPYDFERDQRASDAQLTALAATFRALDERPERVVDLFDERKARVDVGYSNVFPFHHNKKRPAA